MDQIQDLLKSLIGRIAWGVDRGHGSVFHMEFGAPHLVVREPITPSPGGSAKVRRGLLRRRVHVQGDWSFWVNYGDWTLRTADGVLDSTNDPGSPLDDCLRDLEGQKLLSLEAGQKPNACVLTFDLGAVLEIWPSTEIQDDQWSLHTWNGRIASFQHDGSVVFEDSKPRGDELG